ncbi:MAG: glycosyltransferase family 2 protein [Sideroxydans sp.]|nr:glycosyltransferase family 2 protein [Sideroxydans sp.]
MPHISIVVPVYKAEDCLRELYLRLKSSLSAITEDFELLLIEDCGGDQSWEIIGKLALEDTRVRGFQFSRNFGQHYGITAGLDHCDGDWVIVMDCDLQDRPEEIPRLYAKAQEGFDVVLARRGRRSDPAMKRLMSSIFYTVFRYLAETDYDGEVGNFRIISRKVVLSYRGMREQLRFFGGLVSWMGYSAVSIDVQHDERFAGETTYTFRKLWKLASETIVAFSDKPLRLAVRFGFVISSLAFAYGAYIVYRVLMHGVPIPGWTA